MRGKGRIFPRGNVLWIAYCQRGKEIRESAAAAVREAVAKKHGEFTEVDARKAAHKLLDRRLREIANDREGLKAFIGPQQDRLTVRDLLNALEEDFQLRGVKSLHQTLNHLRIVRAAFADLRAVDVGPETVPRYIRDCRAVGQTPATVNRRTTLLGQSFRPAVKRRRLSSSPEIPRLTEDNVRRGFFETADFERVLAHLPEYLRGFAHFTYFCGWRKSEVASLEWADVDMLGQVIRLPRGHSKNGDGNLLALEGELWNIITRQWALRSYQNPDKSVGLSARVFHRHGLRIGDFRKTWYDACLKAGVGRFVAGPGGRRRYEGKLFHDFRRTSVRNMTRAGVPERVAMDISGHKTRAVFDRFNIVSEEDLRQAMRRTQAYLQAAPKQSVVTPFPEEKPERKSGAAV